MVYFYAITLLVVIAGVSDSSTSDYDGSDTCLFTSSLKFIEQALANISNQLGHVGSRDPSDVGESLTGVTSLLQLSLLKELLGEYKKGSPSNKQQGPAILSRIELLLNTSIQDLTSRLNTIESLLQGLPSDIVSLQKQVNRLSSNIKSIKSNTDLLLRHSNITHNTLTSIDDKLDDDSDEYTPSPLLHSCEEIKSKWPSSPSDYYIIANSHGHARHVYCYMEELCNSTGGWMRVAYLNMTDTSEKCPDGFRLYSENGVRACGRPVSSGGSCAGITFSLGNITYSQVCGKAIGYQVGWPDGAYYSNNKNIDSNYVDGILLTHGNPRSHIWTFIVGTQENNKRSHCPCGSIDSRNPPPFVGNDYYCESGCPTSPPVVGKFYTNDPLWDGHQCGSIETACCQRTGIPWFYKKFSYSTTDNIEMRICLGHETSDEDCAVAQYEIYVK